MSHLEQLMTEAAAAKLLNASKGTLRNWRSKRTGPAYICLGSAIRYSPQALREYLESRTHRPVSPDSEMNVSAD